MKWSVCTSETIHFYCWDDEYVVYNARSGSTHLLDFTSGQILEKLKNNHLDTQEITQALTTLFDEGFAPSASQVGQLLGELETLALIQQEPA